MTELSRRQVVGSSLEGEEPEERLRPTHFDEFVGQRLVRERIQIAVQAAKMRNEPLDHVLLSGPPGLGKTTIAHIIAVSLGVQLHATSGPAVDRKGDLAGILTQLEYGDVLFIDEIHRLNAIIEENLYPAMEDFHFDVIMGTGPGANTIRLPLNQFTLVGATTRAGLLTSPLRSRFGIVERLDFYETDELRKIAARSARILRIGLSEDGAVELARRGRGTPRIVNRWLRRVRDYAMVDGLDHIDRGVAERALEHMEIDGNGLDRMDRQLLLTIVDKFEGGPVGLDTLSAATGESADAIEGMYEPYLLQQGFIQRTSRGRVATARAYDLLGRAAPRAAETSQGALEI